MEDDVEEGTVNMDAVIGQESQFPELVHEDTDTGPSRPDHVCEYCSLADLGNDRLRLPFFSKWAIKRSIRASRFSEEIRQVLLDTDVARQKIGEE